MLLSRSWTNCLANLGSQGGKMRPVGINLAAMVLLTLGANACLGSGWDDPADDQLDVTTEPSLNLVGINTRFEAGFLIIELSFDPLTTAPGDLFQFSGYLDLDTDLNSATGREQTHVEEFVPDPPPPLLLPPVMGVDYYVEVYPGGEYAPLWEVTPGPEREAALCLVDIDDLVLTVSIPRCGPVPCDGIAVGARFKLAVLAGNGSEVTDWAPDDGTPLTATPMGGDLDEDGDIDGSDVDGFKACVSGSGNSPADPDCQRADLDDDDDVDQDDFGLVQRRITGPF